MKYKSEDKTPYVVCGQSSEPKQSIMENNEEDKNRSQAFKRSFYRSFTNNHKKNLFHVWWSTLIKPFGPNISMLKAFLSRSSFGVPSNAQWDEFVVLA